MKYVMFERALDQDLRQRIPVIFPATLVHEQVATAIAPLIENAIVVSAGDVSLFGADLRVGGESSTLGVKSQPEDAMVIALYDYAHGLTDG